MQDTWTPALLVTIEESGNDGTRYWVAKTRYSQIHEVERTSWIYRCKGQWVVTRSQADKKAGKDPSDPYGYEIEIMTASNEPWREILVACQHAKRLQGKLDKLAETFGQARSYFEWIGRVASISGVACFAIPDRDCDVWRSMQTYCLRPIGEMREYLEDQYRSWCARYSSPTESEKIEAGIA